MKIVQLRVANYRGLRDVTIPMSQFGCLIGENNAGKSTLLQSLVLFYSGSTLANSNYFDANLPIRIEVCFNDIADEDLNLLADEHRERIRGIVESGRLSLVRVYDTDGKSSLRYKGSVPTDSRFEAERTAQLLKGKKAGASFMKAVTTEFPELDGKITATMNQGEIRNHIQSLADSLPTDQKVEADIELPTGFDKSLAGFLPEPLYIPAVKDLSDDIKTREGTPFGKILGILLKAIEPQLADAKVLFQSLHKQLNRIIKEDGSEVDERLPEVKVIEQTVERYVQESFSSVSIRIRIPPPELKTVLSSAQIIANDGVDGSVETKGDGLRRAIVFAILRSFVELSRTQQLFGDQSAQGPTRKYMLLFEEPELYLHPNAQQILFEALSIFAQSHHVLVTTHSPSFFSPHATATFVKLRKERDEAISPKPFTCVHAVNLTDIKAKDQFQIICYESNTAAFFAKTVVLVEGDSDYLVFPHIAKLLNIDWTGSKTAVRFCRINGKGSIRRYREFFKRFDTRVVVVSDLDLLLGGFVDIDPPGQLLALRSQLFDALDKIIDTNGDGDFEPSQGKLKDAQKKTDLLGKWKRAKIAVLDFHASKISADEAQDAVNEFFAWERNDRRQSLLQNCSDNSILGKKRGLLKELRSLDVYVLEKGPIEMYYPSEIVGVDKPSKAQFFCASTCTKEAVIRLSEIIEKNVDGVGETEFEVICKGIFR